MCKQKFKYQINHYLSLLPQAQTIDLVGHRLKSEFGIDPFLFLIDRNARPQDKHIIPHTRLEVYAGLLGTSVESLADGTISAPENTM